MRRGHDLVAGAGATVRGRTAAWLVERARRAGGGVALAVLALWWSAAPAASQPAAGGPTLEFREASGCEGLTLYTWNDDRTEVLVLTVDQSRVTLPNGATTFDFGPGSPVAARLEVTATPRDDFPYCSAESSAPVAPTVWTPVSGRVQVIVARRPKATFSPVTVQVDRLVLRAPDGTQVKQRRDIRFTAAIAGPIK